MNSRFESLIVFGIITGILLPVRILFVHFVSDDWIGSLGIITAVSVSVIILAKKRKLGWFGPMLERQIYKFQRGKRGIFIFSECVLMIIILGGMVFTIEQGNSIYSDLKIQIINEIPATSSYQQLLEKTSELTASDLFVGLVMTPTVFINHFPQFSAFVAIVNDRTEGWMQHFYIVGFVENLEILGILLFYRIAVKKTPIVN